MTDEMIHNNDNNENDNNEIVTDSLPLSVREHLMRGQTESAISVLENEYQHSKEEAEQLIADYKESLRERKIALEIQVMNEKASREEEQQKQVIIRWATYGVTILILMILLFMMLS